MREDGAYSEHAPVAGIPVAVQLVAVYLQQPHRLLDLFLILEFSRNVS
jgi:hypothetical protein